MKTRLTLGMATLALGTTLALGLAPQDGKPEKPAAPALKARSMATEKFTVDGVHSSVMFKINHVGVSNFLGRFNEITGHYTFDPTNPTFDIQIPVASVDTNNKNRDEHLLSPDFFNATEFPRLTFKSTNASKTGENMWAVTGDLSLHGVTKPITVTLQTFPAKDIPKMGYHSGFETSFSFKRSDFGMDKYITEGMLGDSIDVTLCVEGAKE